jgi:hypothetical protein
MAVIVAAAGMAIGLTTVTPANAAAARTAFAAMPEKLDKCLDYRADTGPYITKCNFGDYQAWYWDDGIAYTALHQKATGLCLTARNGLLAMKPCLANDAAAFWRVQQGVDGVSVIKNSVTGTCLARNLSDLVQLSTCTGGDSQQWEIVYIDM